MKLPGVAVATICVVVASTISSVESKGYAGPPEGKDDKIDCNQNVVKEAVVTVPNSTVEVVCEVSKVLKPTVQDDRTTTSVCNNKDCTNPDLSITSLCPGATIAGAESGKKATITIPQLPTTTQVFFMQCGTGSFTVSCTAKITVQAAAPQGPQSCAVPDGSVTLQIQQEAGKAHFACGNEFSLIPTEDTQALSADCTKEETVKDLKRSITSSGNYVELTATKKGKKNYCYLCRKSSLLNRKNTFTEGDCKVLVEVSGSTPLLPRLAFALTLPCVLTLLHFTP